MKNTIAFFYSIINRVIISYGKHTNVEQDQVLVQEFITDVTCCGVVFTANLENNLDRVARGELDWRNVLDNFYKTFQDDLVSASDENGMRGNQPTPTDIECICGKTNMVIRNSSNGVFLGCSGYQNIGDDKCKETLNLISGDEAICIDDNEEATYLLIKK